MISLCFSSERLVSEESANVLLGGYRHVDLKGNLIKAMMVMNWLNMIEVEKF